MGAVITYRNGATLPRVPHRWLAGDGPCHDCGAAVGEIHRKFACYYEVCPQCDNSWRICRCRTVDVIPNHGTLRPLRITPYTLEEHEDGAGRTYEMRMQGDEE